MMANVSILDANGFPIVRSGDKQRRSMIRAKFDSAQTTADNRRHWANADSLSADASATASIRKILRSRSRYEVLNNSYGFGIISTLVNDVIGTGPRLQMLLDDRGLCDEIETAWEAWASDIRLSEKLQTMRFSRAVDGESFAILGDNPNNGNEVFLDMQLIEAEQIAAQAGSQDPADGIEYDNWGNPKSYRVLTSHPGSGASLSGTGYTTVPAEFVIHAFRRIRPGQSRGIPETTPALPLFAQLRRYTLAVIEAAEVAADHAAVLQSSGPATSSDDNDVQAFDELTLESRMATVLPEGWTLGQMKAEQPTTTYPEFKREILNEIARCLNMSFNVAAGNSSGYNYASGRLDWQTYYRSIRIDQHFTEKAILEKLFRAWLREWAFLTGHSDIARARLNHTWFWDGQEHVDPSKEANAQETRLRNGITTLAIEAARVGKDWEEIMEQGFREKARAMEFSRQFGVPYIDPHAGTSVAVPEEPEEHKEDGEDDE